MHIISLLNNKGGVFKTTLAYNLAKQYLRNSRRVVAIDFDQQENLARMLPEHTQSGYKATDLPGLEADYVIVDTSPTFVIDHIQLMKKSDLILVPLHLDKMDIEQTISLLETAEAVNVTDKVGLVIIHSGHHTQLYKALRPVAESTANDYGVEILCEMRRNQYVPKASLELKTVFEIQSPPDVRKEFKDLFKSIGKFLSSRSTEEPSQSKESSFERSWSETQDAQE